MAASVSDYLVPCPNDKSDVECQQSAPAVAIGSYMITAGYCCGSATFGVSTVAKVCIEHST